MVYIPPSALALAHLPRYTTLGTRAGGCIYLSKIGTPVARMWEMKLRMAYPYPFDWEVRPYTDHIFLANRRV